MHFFFFSPPLCNPGDGAYSYFKHLKHLKRQHFELVINNFFRGITREPFTRSCHSSRLLNTLIAYLKREKRKRQKMKVLHVFRGYYPAKDTAAGVFSSARKEQNSSAALHMDTITTRVHIYPATPHRARTFLLNLVNQFMNRISFSYFMFWSVKCPKAQTLSIQLTKQVHKSCSDLSAVEQAEDMPQL